ncbi:MAG: NYN domain-containing protein [bacterium]|jgi:uncharacterized LabA/DUF88 family protein
MKRTFRKSPAYAFIDSQNLNLGIQKMGWKLDWRKFRQYLKDVHGVTNAYMFIGYMHENEALYEYMHELGYLVVLKPTVDITPNQDKDKNKHERHTVKGNVDVELALYALKEMPNYKKAIVVSGDGDFYALAEYLEQKSKLAKILTPNWQYSSLLKAFDNNIIRLDQMRSQLEYRDRKPRKKQ